MFKISYNSKRSSLNAGNPAQRWRSVILALALVLIIGTVNPTPSAQAAPAGSTELSFFMLANKEGGSKPVCVGELVTIEVLVLRLKVVNGVSEAPEAITGISVNGVVDNPNIGQISPSENTTIWASAIYPGAADFVFTAEKPGETIVAFSGMIVHPGWFGTNWGGSSQIVSDQVSVKVIPCKFKVEATSRWNNNVGGIYLAMMDEIVLRADAEGRYSGSANVNWIGTFMMDSCPKEYTIPSGQAKLTGELNDSGQLIATLTYQPVAVTFNGACGNLSGWDDFQVSQDPLRFSVPASGGVFALPQFLIGSREMGIFDGSVAIVVIPQEDETTAFNPSNRVMDNGFPSTWAAMFWDNFPWLYGTMLAVH
jgi:hypothetical protein